MTTVFNPPSEDPKAAFPTMKPRTSTRSGDSSQQQQNTNRSQSNSGKKMVGDFNVSRYVQSVIDNSLTKYKAKSLDPRFGMGQRQDISGAPALEAFPKRGSTQKEEFPKKSGSSDQIAAQNETKEAFPSRTAKQQESSTTNAPQTPQQEAFPSRTSKQEAFPSRTAKQEQPPQEAFPSRAPKQEQPQPEAFPSKTEAFQSRAAKQEQPQPQEAFPSRSTKQEPPQQQESFPSRSNKQETAKQTEEFPSRTAKKEEPPQKPEPVKIEAFPTKSQKQDDPLNVAIPPKSMSVEAIAPKEFITHEETQKVEKKIFGLQNVEEIVTKPGMAAKMEAVYEMSHTISPRRAAKAEVMFESPKFAKQLKKSVFIAEPKREQSPHKNTKTFPTLPNEPKQEVQSIFAPIRVESPKKVEQKTIELPKKAEPVPESPRKVEISKKPEPVKEEAFPTRKDTTREHPKESFPTRARSNSRSNDELIFVKSYVNGIISRCVVKHNSESKNSTLDAFPKRGSTSKRSEPEPAKPKEEELSAFPSRPKKPINKEEEPLAFPTRAKKTESQPEEPSAFPSRAKKTEEPAKEHQPEVNKLKIPSMKPLKTKNDDDNLFCAHPPRHHSPNASDIANIPRSPRKEASKEFSEDSNEYLPPKHESLSPSKKPAFPPPLPRKPPMIPRHERSSSMLGQRPADLLKKSASTGSQNILLRKDLKAHFEPTDSSELKHALEKIQN